MASAAKCSFLDSVTHNDIGVAITAIQPQPEVDCIGRLGAPAAEMTNRHTLEAEQASYAHIGTHTYLHVHLHPQERDGNQQAGRGCQSDTRIWRLEPAGRVWVVVSRHGVGAGQLLTLVLWLFERCLFDIFVS